MTNKNVWIDLEFSKTGHFWQDAGLIGFKNILTKIVKESGSGTSLNLEEDRLLISGDEKSVQKSIEKAYDVLVEKYYNLSTERQKEDRENYNFYYDSEKNDFFSFPKRKARGIAWLIFDQPPKASAREVRWKNKTKHTLPEEYSHLQKRLDSFLEQNNLKGITASAMLVDGPNEVRPKLDIDIANNTKKEKGTCYICGKQAATFSQVGSTILPLLTGSSGGLSFNSNGGSPEKACWKCALLGKFVPANGFYYRSNSNLFMFFPHSRSLRKMDEVLPSLEAATWTDPNYNQNFKVELGAYFQKSFETTLAFFHSLYLKLVKEKTISDNTRSDLLDLYNFAMEDAEINFYVLAANHTGTAFAIKSLWLFMDTVYIFKLFNELEKSANIDIKEVMRLLVDYNAKNDGMTLSRNRICERILKKKPIADLLEQFVYHSNNDKKVGYIKPLFDFLMFYENQIGGRRQMTPEEQNAAVKLGKRLGYAIGSTGDGRKSDLYTLRRTKNRETFLEQLNRLQFRMGEILTIPPEIYEGSLTVQNFREFKQFCMIAALNSFFAAKNHSKQEKE